MQWYYPAGEPGGTHFGYAGPRWVQFVPLVLQLPMFLVLFRAFATGRLDLLVWAAAATSVALVAFMLVARRLGVGHYVVDAFGQPIRPASRRLDGVPRVLRKRGIVEKDEFLQLMSRRQS